MRDQGGLGLRKHSTVHQRVTPVSTNIALGLPGLALAVVHDGRT